MIDFHARNNELIDRAIDKQVSEIVKVWLGVDDSMKQHFVVASPFSLPQALLTKLQELSYLRMSGLKFITANTIFPAYVRLNKAYMPAGVNHPKLVIFAKEVEELESVQFDTLTFDGVNLVLEASVITDAIRSLHERLDSDMLEQGLQPSAALILRTTLQRIHRRPFIKPEEAWTEYLMLLNVWQTAIARNPVSLDLSNVKLGTEHELLLGR